MFNLLWFKTRKQKEALNELKIEEQSLKNEILEQQLFNMADGKKPYKKIKFVNDILTVIFNDGNILSKTQATINDFLNVKLSNTEKEIIDIMRGVEEREDILEDIYFTPTYDDVQAVCNYPDFSVNEECVYMNGIERSLPPLLIKRFGEIIGKYNCCNGMDAVQNDIEYTSLKKFWLKACLNPNSQSAEDLYTFLSHHNMKIDRHGNFFAYRRVCKVGNMDSNLVDLISSAYNNVKAVWKKKVEDFRIEELDGVYSLHKCTSTPKGTIVGNLDSLYKDLPNMKENRYTDQHTHTMDYRVGEIASIPRNECDDDNNINCSRGLHSCSKEYSYNGFGDTPILVIINPCDCVAVPLNEIGKLRVSRFFFAMTLEEEDKYILDDDDFDVTNLGDVFEEKCLANIEEHVHTSFTEEVARHTFSIPQMSNVDIKNISDMLKDMNDVIKNRIITN